MTIYKSLLLSLVLICIAQFASADEIEYSSKFSDCMDKSGGVTIDMLDCINDELERQDARLNKVYKEVMALLSPERQKALREAQRAWIKYRDTNCNFYYDPEGGSLARIKGNACFLEATASRANELGDIKQYLDY